MPYGRSGKNFTGKAKTITGTKNYGTGRANPRTVNRTIRQNNRNGVRNNLVARPGEYVNARTGQPYTGPIHMHDGTAMVGATHSSTPHDYLRRTGRNRRIGRNRRTMTRTTPTRNTMMRTTSPMSTRRTTRNHSGGHMHNLQNAQTNVQDYQTVHRHFTEAPSQWDPMTGEPLYLYQNAPFNALFHRHFEYDNAGDESSPDAGMTSRPYWHAYGTTDTPGFNTATGNQVAPGQPQGNLPYFPTTMNVSGQTTGEVGSVPGAGHVHRASPNVRGRNGNGRTNRRNR